MNDHPVGSHFESFLRGSASPVVIRVVVRHLLAACPACRATLRAMGWEKERLEHLVSLMTGDPDDLPGTPSRPGYDYDESFTKAWRACARELLTPSLRQDGTQPEDAYEALEFEDLPASMEDLVPDARVVISFLDRSHAARYQDPRRMLYWARLARLMAERCDGERAGGVSKLADLRARAWGQLGNALRVAGRLRDAEQALGRAGEYAADGTGDPALRLDLLSYQASLATFGRDFARSIELLDEACAIARNLGNQTELAKCSVNKAIAAVYSGEPVLAIQILDDAIPLIDGRDHRLLFAAFNSLGYCYLEAGRLQEALAILPQARELAHRVGDELVVLRVMWQEAKILYELGLLEEAEALFSRTRDGFVERDLAYEVAVVSLDLAAIYLRLGLIAEVRRTVADILPFFSSIGVRRELLASLIQLQQAEDQTKALELIRTVSRELVSGPKLPTAT
jgi:tetratricopeptide (TPR) repeat protein